MKKRKKIFLAIIVFAVLGIGLLLYLWFGYYKISLKDIEINYYPDVPITETERDAVNQHKAAMSSMYEMWDIPKRENGEYGHYFDVVYRFNVERFSDKNDYIIDKILDFSELESMENIFFAQDNGYLNSYVFRDDGNGREAVTYVSLVGYSSDKTEEELTEIVKKVKIKFIIQDKNGQIQEKMANISGAGVNYCNRRDQDSVGLVREQIDFCS